MRTIILLLIPAILSAGPIRPRPWKFAPTVSDIWHLFLPLPQVRVPGPGGYSPATSSMSILGHLQVRENGTTSSTMDTTASGGATLIVANCGCHTAGQTPDTPIDSQGNTYTPLTLRSFGTGIVGRLFYKLSPTNSSVMAWHTAGSNCSAAFCYIGAFSGPTAFDSTSEAVSSVCSSTTTASSFTPSVSGELVIGGEADFTSPVVSSVSSPMAIVESHVGGSFDGGALAWGVQPSTSVLTVTFTWANCNGLAGGYMAAFKP